MATQAATLVSRVAPNGQYLNEGGQAIEVYRVASGAASADTIAITPIYITDITHLVSSVGVSDNLSTTASNTAVTCTIQSGTVTVGAFFIKLYGSAGR